MHVSVFLVLFLFAIPMVICMGGRANAGGYGGHPTCRSEISQSGQGMNALEWPHIDGLSNLGWTSRTPSGFLYAHPMEFSVDDGNDEAAATEKTSSGWTFTGALEAGVLKASGTIDTASFREYHDWGKEAVTGQFRLFGFDQDSGRYLQASGTNVGRDNGCYQLSYGQYGAFKVGAFFNAVPHIFTTQARLLWNGAGTGNLTLGGGLTAGGNEREEVVTAFETLAKSRLSLKREKGGVALSYHLSKSLVYRASLDHEWRNGTRPIGGAFGFPGSSLTETVEPIRYRTLEVRTGIDYTGRKLNARLNYSGSFFKNRIDSLTWENPGLLPFAAPHIVTQGQMALAPDNHYHALSADISVPLPEMKGYFTATANWSVSRQDADLLPNTIEKGVLPNAGPPIDLSLWNTPASLSQPTADAHFERLTATSSLVVAPGAKVRLKFKLRIDKQENDTNYLALNPQTGEYGYLALNGALGGMFPGFSGLYDPAKAGNRVRVRSMPFATDRWRASLKADYRLSSKSKLEAVFEHKEAQRFPREVSETRNDLWRLSYSNRSLKKATMRFSYEYENRTGSNYVSNPYEAYYSSSLAGYIPRFEDGDAPHTLADLRKYDIAPRSKHKFDAKVNFILTDRMDMNITGQYDREDYQADYGLKDLKGWRLNGEWTYQVDPAASIYAFLSFDDGERVMSNITDKGLISSDARAGGAVYPLENAWSVRAEENNIALGAGYSKRFESWTLDLTYSYTRSRSRFLYDFTSSGAFHDLFTADEVGNGFPEQTYAHHLVTGSARIPLKENFHLRLLYRFEKEDLSDFHYDGFTSPVINHDIYLLAVPRDYSAHIVGAFLAVGF